MMLTQFTIEPGSVIPVHHHPHEQIGCLMSGTLELTVADRTYTASPGDSWCIAPDVPHGAKATESCVVIEVFCPVREDYLPK